MQCGEVAAEAGADWATEKEKSESVHDKSDEQNKVF